MVEVYRTVLVRLLISLVDEEKEFSAMTSNPSVLAVHEDRLRGWPPQPFPPWPSWPDEPGDEPKEPVNRTQEAKRLAEGIIVFEKKLANASFDLWVSLSLTHVAAR